MVENLKANAANPDAYEERQFRRGRNLHAKEKL